MKSYQIIYPKLVAKEELGTSLHLPITLIELYNPIAPSVRKMSHLLKQSCPDHGKIVFSKCDI